MNQKSQHEIHPAAADDIAVNFIILPEFFDYVLKMIGEEKNLLRDFVIDCLTVDADIKGFFDQLDHCFGNTKKNRSLLNIC